MSVTMEGWSEFHRHYPAVIDAIGENDFLARLSELLTSIVDYESMVVMGFSADAPPVIGYNDTTFFEKQSVDKEFIGALVLDPFYQLIKRGTREGIYKLSDIAPDEFYMSDYYHKIYKQTGLKQELGMIVTCSEGYTLVLSLGLRGKDKVDFDEKLRLEQYFAEIKSAIRKHYELGDPQQRTIGHQLNDIFSNFGKDFLSERECQVTQLVLQGYSTKAIAPLLEVSTETVKVYRKRIHNKLKISSQSELFSLFLEAASTVPANSNIDPLTVYFDGKHVH